MTDAFWAVHARDVRSPRTTLCGRKTDGMAYLCSPRELGKLKTPPAPACRACLKAVRVTA